MRQLMCASRRENESDRNWSRKKGDFVKGMKDERFELLANLWSELKYIFFVLTLEKTRTVFLFCFFSFSSRRAFVMSTCGTVHDNAGYSIVLVPIPNSNPSLDARVQDTERQQQQSSLTQILTYAHAHTHTHTHSDVTLFAVFVALPWLLPPVHRSIYDASMPSTQHEVPRVQFGGGIVDKLSPDLCHLIWFLRCCFR